MLAADSVAINRLQIKGDKRTSQTLVRELEQSSWAKPLPAHLQDAWVLVRELSVKGKARDFRRQTAQHLDTELQHAVRAIHGNAAAANVIWFATFPELIAFLLVDLALGKATHWYWSRWSYLLKYPRAEAIARLLCENIEHLPAVVMQLQSRQQLTSVFSHLSNGSAKTLVRELARVWGFPEPSLLNNENPTFVTITQEVFQQLQAQEKLLVHWRVLLQGLDAKDGRVILAAIIHGLTYTPLWLQQKPAELVEAVARLVCITSTNNPQLLKDISATRAQDSVGVITKQTTPFDKISDKHLQHSGEAKVESSVSETVSLSNKNEQIFVQDRSDKTISTQSAPANSLISPKPITAEIIAETSSSPLSGDNQNSINPNAELIDEANPDYETSMVGYEFITRAGGFFYLLNPLSWLLTPERLAQQSHSSAWHWLLDLYRLFAQGFPAVAEVIDAPLQRFILQQLQPGSTPQELQTLAQQLIALPPSEFAQELFAELEARYQQTEFWCELKNSPGFFAVPARVIATTSHWDIYLSLQAVRLDLRLVGWDINPGWLPWLGRVVALHYVEQPIASTTEEHL